jgi:hypothetical protein
MITIIMSVDPATIELPFWWSPYMRDYSYDPTQWSVNGVVKSLTHLQSLLVDAYTRRVPCIKIYIERST